MGSNVTNKSLSSNSRSRVLFPGLTSFVGKKTRSATFQPLRVNPKNRFTVVHAHVLWLLAELFPSVAHDYRMKIPLVLIVP